MTYFHGCPSTIIGAKAFHCPVRDGKEWYHLAMVVRRRRCELSFMGLDSRIREEAHGAWEQAGLQESWF